MQASTCLQKRWLPPVDTIDALKKRKVNFDNSPTTNSSGKTHTIVSKFCFELNDHREAVTDDMSSTSTSQPVICFCDVRSNAPGKMAKIHRPIQQKTKIESTM